MSLPKTFSKSVLIKDSGKAAKDRGFQIDTEVLFYDEQYGRPKSVRTAIMSGAVVVDHYMFQLRLHGVDLNSVSGSDLVAIKAVTVKNSIFPISYFYEFYCASMAKVQEILGCPDMDSTSGNYRS